jgi:hypothetical protein
MGKCSETCIENLSINNGKQTCKVERRENNWREIMKELYSTLK